RCRDGTQRGATGKPGQSVAQRLDVRLERLPGGRLRLRARDPRLEAANGRPLDLNHLIDHVLPLDTAGQATEASERFRHHHVRLRVLTFRIGSSRRDLECDGPGRRAARAPSAQRSAADYWSRRRMTCGAAFAWASIAVPACCRIWFFVKVDISCAMSASRIVDSAAA